MADQDLINSSICRVWLNEIGRTVPKFVDCCKLAMSSNPPDTPSGIFSLDDTGKFHGDLMPLDIQPDTGDRKLRTTALFSLSLTNLMKRTSGFSSGGFEYPAALDSRTTLILLPQDLHWEIADFVGVVQDPDQGALDFVFGELGRPVISVLNLPFPLWCLW